MLPKWGLVGIYANYKSKQKIAINQKQCFSGF